MNSIYFKKIDYEVFIEYFTFQILVKMKKSYNKEKWSQKDNFRIF